MAGAQLLLYTQDSNASSKTQPVPTDLSTILFVAQAGEERYEREKKGGMGEKSSVPICHTKA